MALTDNQEQPKGPRPMYILCPTCRVKNSLGAYFCRECGGRCDRNEKTGKYAPMTVYGSGNPDDVIFNIDLNDYTKCVNCPRVQKGGGPCAYASCFGTGKGNCGVCERFSGARHSCCQKRRAAVNEFPVESVIKNLEKKFYKRY
jgi:hypothetical protein